MWLLSGFKRKNGINSKPMPSCRRATRVPLPRENLSPHRRTQTCFTWEGKVVEGHLTIQCHHSKMWKTNAYQTQSALPCFSFPISPYSAYVPAFSRSKVTNKNHRSLKNVQDYIPFITEIPVPSLCISPSYVHSLYLGAFNLSRGFFHDWQSQPVISSAHSCFNLAWWNSTSSSYHWDIWGIPQDQRYVRPEIYLSLELRMGFRL